MSEVVLAVVGVVFSAFAIWLTVRIVNRREKWAKPTAVALVAVLVGYPLSFGPACWTVSHADLSENLVNIPYRPILSLHQRGPRWLRRWIHNYSLSTSAHGWGLRTVIYLDLSKGPDGEDVELTEWRRLAR